jgi:hypothetical protein
MKRHTFVMLFAVACMLSGHIIKTYDRKFQSILSNPKKLETELKKTISDSQEDKVKQLLAHAKPADMKKLLVGSDNDLEKQTKTPLMQLAKNRAKKPPKEPYAQAQLALLSAFYFTLPILLIAHNIMLGSDTRTFIAGNQNIQNQFWQNQCFGFVEHNPSCDESFYKFLFRQFNPYDAASSLTRNVSLLAFMTFFFFANGLATLWDTSNSRWQYCEYGLEYTSANHIYQHCKKKKEELKTLNSD